MIMNVLVNVYMKMVNMKDILKIIKEIKKG
jgi:hypothetical protein